MPPNNFAKHLSLLIVLSQLIAPVSFAASKSSKSSDKYRPWIGFGPLVRAYHIPGTKGSVGMGLQITPLFRAELSYGVWAPDTKSTIAILGAPILFVGYVVTAFVSLVVNSGKNAVSPDQFMGALGLDNLDTSHGHSAFAIGGRLFVPHWRFSPTIGMYSSHIHTWGGAEGYPEKMYYNFYSAGFDWYVGRGFSLEAGANFAPQLPTNNIGAYVGFAYVPTGGFIHLVNAVVGSLGK